MATLVCERRCRSLRSPATSLGNEASGVRGGAVLHRSPSLCAPFSLLTCKGARHEAPPLHHGGVRCHGDHRNNIDTAWGRQACGNDQLSRPPALVGSEGRCPSAECLREVLENSLILVAAVGCGWGSRLPPPLAVRPGFAAHRMPHNFLRPSALRRAEGRCSSRSFGTTASRAPPSICNVFHPRPKCVVRDSL